jgi:hypothetical protein
VKHEEELPLDIHPTRLILHTTLIFHGRESPAVKKAYRRRGDSLISLRDVVGREREGFLVDGNLISLCFSAIDHDV